MIAVQPEEVPMRKQRDIARFIVLMLTPVVLWSANILPIHSSQSAQAATNASHTKPNDQPASRAVANGKLVFSDGAAIYTMDHNGRDMKRLTFDDSRQWNPVWSP